MEPLSLLLLLLFTTVSAKSHVQPRGLWELGGTIKCTTNRVGLAYASYGCYCGVGGSGWPQDEVDWCCQKHDCCYGTAEAAGCNPKKNHYHWDCKNKRVECGANQNKCREMACKCDQEFAHCLAKAKYSAKYILFPHFRCGSKSPQCD